MPEVRHYRSAQLHAELPEIEQVQNQVVEVLSMEQLRIAFDADAVRDWFFERLSGIMPFELDKEIALIRFVGK